MLIPSSLCNNTEKLGYIANSYNAYNDYVTAYISIS